jgi:transposase, IS6 family
MKPSCELRDAGSICSAPSTAKGQTVDFYLSETRDREAAKHFLKKALANPDNRPPRVFARDGLRSYPAAIHELQKESLMHPRCQH